MANIFSGVKRHKKITATAVILILAIGYYFLAPSGKSANATIYTYGTAVKGNIIQSVSGSGQVAASDQVDVKSRVAGNIISMNVAAGQTVSAGDILAKIDAADAQAAMDTARANLDSAKLALQKAGQDNSLSLAQAQQALQQANDALTQSRDNLSKTYEQAFNTVAAAFSDLPLVMSGLDDIATGSNNIVVQSSGTYLNYYQYQIGNYGSSTAQLLDVGSTYTVAKDSYSRVLAEYKGASRYSDPAAISEMVEDTYDATKKISNAIKALVNLIQQYQDAAANNNSSAQSFSTTHLNSLNGYATQVNAHLVNMLSMQQSIQTAIENVATAKNTIDQKTQSLNTLQNLTNPISDQSQQLSVSQKETALADAREVLDDYTIRAPFDGLVTTVGVKAGDAISANTAIATVITNNQVAAITLNEVDVANVKIGQKATLTFDAIGDLTMVGHVSEIDTVGTVSQGVVSYGVTIAFDARNDQVKPGMSATAAIITKVKQDLLLVPNSAIKSNTAGNYVFVPAVAVDGAVSGSSDDGVTVKQQMVTVGLADDNYTEIVSGLSEDDTVVIKTSTQTLAKTSSNNSSVLSRMFGGGGGPR
ncbi:MAG: efflux RND transporter periplasmic adaptor subunit [Candidatus Paceibacterota bacterium]